MVTEFPFALSCLLSIAVGVVLLLTVEWRLGLALSALLPLVIVGPRWLGARAGRASYERQRDAAAVMSALEESIAAHSVIKAFDLQGILLAGFGRRLATLYRSTVRASLLSGLQGTSISGSGSILLVLAISGGATLAVRGELSVGGLVAVIDLLWFIVANLHALSKVLPPMQRASGGMLRIQEVLDAQEQVVDTRSHCAGTELIVAVLLFDHARTGAIPAVDRACSGDEKEHPVGIAMHEARNRAVGILGKGIDRLFGSSNELPVDHHHRPAKRLTGNRCDPAGSRSMA